MMEMTVSMRSGIGEGGIRGSPLISVVGNVFLCSKNVFKKLD